jgi:phosphoribosylaminoimidazole-succinocarboxamide synthase
MIFFSISIFKVQATVSDMAALINTDLPGLTLISRGKVRDIYSIISSPEHLLFVATDRISAYDVILRNVRVTDVFPST